MSPLTSLFYKDRGKTKRLSRWHAGVASCSMLAFAVLVINFVLLVWAVSKKGIHHGYGKRFLLSRCCVVMIK